MIWIKIKRTNESFSRVDFVGSFDGQWSDWYRITDPGPDHTNGKHINVSRLV